MLQCSTLSSSLLRARAVTVLLRRTIHRGIVVRLRISRSSEAWIAVCLDRGGSVRQTVVLPRIATKRWAVRLGVACESHQVDGAWRSCQHGRAGRTVVVVEAGESGTQAWVWEIGRLVVDVSQCVMMKELRT